jgi:hypothetical protein
MKIVCFFDFQKQKTKLDMNMNLIKIVLLSKSIKVKILIYNLPKKVSINKENDKIIVKIISNCL